MNSETRNGLGLVFALALCCAGPIIVSLLGSGVVFVAMSGVWANARPLLMGMGALLVIIGILVLALAKRARVAQRVHPETSTARQSPPVRTL
jgi:hypothetical protein